MKTRSQPRLNAGEASDLKRHLFYETSHSPSLVDLVGYEKAREIVDFCFIANPYYPTAEMMTELQARLPTLIKSYPSSNPLNCQKHLAAVLHVDPEHLLIGNGATELIALIDETLVDHIAVPVPTFGEYLEKLKNLRDAELYRLNPKENYQLDLTRYLAWIHQQHIKSALIINPGNPTGQLHPLADMEDFLRQAKDLELVIVDESFIDFAGEDIPSLLPHAERYSNLLIVRSMSKHCGVPGLRLGYCYSSNLYLLNRLRRYIPTWNVNALAEYFLSLLPATDADYHVARKRLISDVRYLDEALRRIPALQIYPTGGNFVLMKILGGRTAAQLQEQLLKDFGMYVRDCSNKIGMDSCHVRVASQGREKDETLIAALDTLFKR
ncbi:MAG TPA: histidinol-phosphate transaminase [Elusimicrobiota bacterium]|nr:histidinol-phosphate transaminase [Elusimicrobiota bacterium]